MSNLNPVEIRDSILTNLDTNFSRCAVAWPNTKFDPDSQATNGHWVRPNILMSRSEIGELGLTGLSFRFGTLKIQVFAPKNEESREAWLNAGSIEALYRRAVTDCIIYDEPSTNEIGTDDKYYQLAVDIPFTVLTE